MSVTACAISLPGAVKVCAEPWESERDARWAAETLEGAGYRVHWWPEPVELELPPGLWSVATVCTPSGVRIGDVTYEGEVTYERAFRAPVGECLSGPG